MLLQEIANVESPGYIYGNNEASISIPNNKQLSNITKNIDITEQFIRWYVYEGRIELKKIRPKKNSSDITKNVPVET